MSDQTAITWCDSTFNPWVGCTKISPACDNCYAERLMDHRMHRVQWGPGEPRVRTSEANWNKPLVWERAAWKFVQCSACGRRGPAVVANGTTRCGSCGCQDTTPARRRVFCASLADVFDNEVLAAWRADLFQLIADTPHLDWLLLTKRIGNVEQMTMGSLRAMFHRTDREPPTWPWPNVWLGATICNQAEADRDIPKLLAVPAVARFLSIEPMLGPITINPLLISAIEGTSQHGQRFIDWVICGGESGSHARPMHPDWVSSLRDQCASAQAPFHFKQWGEWAPNQTLTWAQRMRNAGQFKALYVRLDGSTHWIGKDDHELYSASDVQMVKIGVKEAGRRLDSIEHNGFPAPAA